MLFNVLFIKVRGSAFLLIRKFMVALPDHPSIFAVGMPDLASVEPAALSADDSARKRAVPCHITFGGFPFLKFILYHVENLIGTMAGWLFST